MPRPPLTGGNAREKLLDAALVLIRQKGYGPTSVDDLCRAARVSKGSFFHHFRSKEDLGKAAIEHWNAITGHLFAQADYHRLSSPRDRLLAYIDLRAGLIQGDPTGFSCLLGTIVQEVHDSSPELRDACSGGIAAHLDTLLADIAAAKAAHAPDAPWSPDTLARHIQATLQGGFILAKASGKPEHALECTAHLRRYVEMLLPEAA